MPPIKRNRHLRTAAHAAGFYRIEPLEERMLLSALTIAQENQLPGTPQSQWDISGAGDTTLQGFATNMSVNVGNTISFKIDDTTQGSYHINIYRLGYYAGNGAHLAATIASSQVLKINQPNGLTDPSTGLYDCGNWSVSASWTVPTDATSGVYIADLVRDTNGAKSQIPFIVRNDASHSAMVFQTSDTTWQAYNDYGGKSLYDYQSTNSIRAYKVSYNRPFNTRADSGGDYLFSAEYPMIRWIEENGYDVSYISELDTDRLGSLLTNHQLFLSVGHDEYWSGAQRANVQAARDAGVNLAFFSSNEDSWKTRWESSIDGSGTSYRTLVCYKESIEGQLLDPTGIWTGMWADPRFTSPLPGNQLSGQEPIINYGGVAMQVAAADGKMRFWRNTTVASLTGTQVATLAPNTLGYEWDVPVDNGFQPAGLVYLSTNSVSNALVLQGYGQTYAPGPATAHMTLYKAASGAIVFGSGTSQWSWGLDNTHDTVEGTSNVDARMQQATVNLFADMGLQPSTLQSGLVRASASTDKTPPTAVITSPTNNATVAMGRTLTIRGSATDAVGGVVGSVEVSVDGGLTWHPATGRGTWTYTWAPPTGGTYTIKARATDDSLNTQTTPASITLNVTGVTGQTILGGVFPASTAQPDSAIEVGVKFQTDVSGQIMGIRFYKFSSNTGTHIGNLWDSNGNRLATVTFTNETASGWQYASFSTPVTIQANTTYIASYFMSAGNYAEDDYYFYAPAGSGDLTALQDGASGGNGVYHYGSTSAFPDSTYNAANYYVDVVFQGGANTTPPTVTSTTPTSGATGVSTSASVSAVFSEAINASTLSFTLKTSSGATVAGATAYNAATHIAAFTPGSLLATGTTYTATVNATDLSGRAMTAPAVWSFTTGTSNAISIFSSNPVPANPSEPDAASIEVGLKFQSSVAGSITAIRFYKGTGNTGTHIGHLWSSTGTLLATVTFSNKTASGWQQANLSTPVAISANTTYVVSYFAPSGHYSEDDNYFANGGVSNGPLSAVADGTSGGNGVYNYGSSSALPTNTYLAANYYVDVIFQPGTSTTPPTVTSTSPTSGATGVPTSTSVSAVFSVAINSSTLSFTLKNSSGATIAGTTAYTAATNTATFTPSSALALATTYTATVNATDLSGHPMSAPAIWSFTTASSNAVSIFSPNAVPANPSAPDSAAVTVGMKFQSSVAGSITAIRFYKGTGNTGTHIGYIWDANGNLLATVTFTNETATGWQTAALSTPLQIAANTTYIVSYYAPNGHYAADQGYFAPGNVSSGSLTALSDTASGGNGVYAYGTGTIFPTQTYLSSNYWVDVVFVSA